MNVMKKKQTQRCREQTSGYQWGEERAERQDKVWRLRGKNYYVQINKQQRYIVQHWEYRQYFIITLNGV